MALKSSILIPINFIGKSGLSLTSGRMIWRERWRTYV